MGNKDTRHREKKKPKQKKITTIVQPPSRIVKEAPKPVYIPPAPPKPI